ncbi:MAG TPA: hypothetical protein VMU71_02710 [Terracidiphilus sp.]|nr:hypothetical protein [Terracidiphilus sp.]
MFNTFSDLASACTGEEQARLSLEEQQEQVKKKCRGRTLPRSPLFRALVMAVPGCRLFQAASLRAAK